MCRTRLSGGLGDSLVQLFFKCAMAALVGQLIALFFQ